MVEAAIDGVEIRALGCDDGIFGDIDGDGSVGIGDLLALLASWGPCPAPCPEDLNGDGMVDIQDLLDLLSAWT